MWYYESNHTPTGPVTDAEIRQLIGQGTILATTRVWEEGMDDWLPASSTGFADAFAAASPVAAVSPSVGTGSPFAETPVSSGYSDSPFAPPQAYGSHGYAPTPTGEAHELIAAIEKNYRNFIATLIATFLMIPVLIVAVVVAVISESPPVFVFPVLAFLVMMGVSIASWVFQLIMVYKMWSLIPPEIARTTPGRAAGFMLIPLFNIYWVFVAFHGLAQDMNETLRYQGKRPSVNETMPLVYCISVVVSCIPYIGALAGMVNLVFIFLMYNELINGARALLNVPQK